VTTIAGQLIKDFANKWDNALPSAVFSGIVGDAQHAASGGYHISIEDQVNPQNYSVVRVDDAAPPGDWPRNEASAVDMSMSLQDMVLTYTRVKVVWENANDPRRKYINAVNVFDGIGDAERLDFVSGSRTYASPDHKWHTHLEVRRRYVHDPAAFDAAFSMVNGESLSAYLNRTNQLPPPPPPIEGHAPGTRDLWNNGGPNYMTGADVAYVQRFIGPRRCGLADGEFGPNTESGVRWYQGMRGLHVDGIVGPQTWSNILGRTVRY
jgi:hypothetical protein